MQSNEIRQRFLDFFAKRGHAILPSASLVPENDPSVLFNTAGMQPLVPYLLGQKHPLGQRLASCQKCVRTGDLDDIGDNRHFSFFEMLGNWSLGDYFKEDAIEYSYKFLTNGDNEENGNKGLGSVIKKEKLYVTVFCGDEHSDRDTQSVEIWKKQGIPENRIYFLGVEDNWWGAGDTGPCGPCTEMFYDMTGDMGDLSHEEFVNAVKSEDIIEIWNDVFMTYNKQVKDEYKLEYEELKLQRLPIPSHYYFLDNLPNKNVDTGAGLERLTAVMQGKKTAYETDLFKSAMETLSSDLFNFNIKTKRIILDHVRTAVFMIGDGVKPGNKDQGYVLRKLLRRAAKHTSELGDKSQILTFIAAVYIDEYQNVYSDLITSKDLIINEIRTEEERYRKAVTNGGIVALKKYFNMAIGGIDPDNLPVGMVIRDNKIRINGKEIFDLYQTHGLPIEISQEIMTGWGVAFDDQTMKEAQDALEEHQKLSQTSSAGMFKGGLANHNEKTIRLHTAHHLLLAGLQEVLGKSVKQRGSNITEERLRMDFAFDRKVTAEELSKVENLVNGWINDSLPVVRKEMPLTEAEQLGAEMEFGAKYPDMVSVYMIKNSNDEFVSKEFCGGPHVGNTSELGKFKIQKEEASSAGVRRIKAVLE